MTATDTTTPRELPATIYPRLPNGRVDWRALINPVHIVFNSKNEKVAKEIEATYGAPAKTLVYAEVAAKQPVQDKHILILLAGFMELAELRGYTRSVPTHLQIGQGVVASAWEIDWIPNEEDPLGKTSGATADATMENTGGFGYLTAMAGNRAFVRAVKNGLGIRILGFDEIATKDTPLPESGETGSSSSSPSSIAGISLGSIGQPVPTLIRTCTELKCSFEKLKKGAMNKWTEETEKALKDPQFRRSIEGDPNTWTKFEDVPARTCLTLIDLLKKGAEVAAKKKAEKDKVAAAVAA